MNACPYEALYIDPDTHTAAKCNYCAHRVEVGLQPACVLVCPEQAIISGDLEDPTSQIAQLVGRENVQVRKPEKGTKPQLFYLGADQTALNPEATGSSVGYMWSQPNTRLHGREEAPPPVAPVYRPLDFKTMLSADSGYGAADAGSDSALITAPPPQGRTIIPLAEIKSKTSGGTTPPAIRPGESELSPRHSVVAGLMANGTDAQVAYNISHERPWGFLVALYLWTKSIGAGAFIVLALTLGFGLASDTTLFNILAPLVTLLFISLTTALLVADLKHPERFLYLLFRSNWTSWLVWGAYILIGFTTVAGLWLLDRITGLTGLESILLWPGVGLGIMSAIYSAFLFGQAKGRDFWQSPLLAPHLFIQATLAGAAALLILGFAFSTNTAALNLLTLTLLFTLIANVTVVLGEVSLPHVNNHVSRCVHVIRSGKLSGSFWWGFVFSGTIAPVILLSISLVTGVPGLLGAIAAGLALAGLLIYENIWITAGQSVPLS
jgi:formate-dependent nitrite reductase membrane component NrfD